MTTVKNYKRQIEKCYKNKYMLEEALKKKSKYIKYSK